MLMSASDVLATLKRIVGASTLLISIKTHVSPSVIYNFQTKQPQTSDV